MKETESTGGGVRLERPVRRGNNFQNGNSSKLPSDVCRCVSATCHVRDLCARFMDSPAGPYTPYADLTNECQDIGSERMFIPWKG